MDAMLEQLRNAPFNMVTTVFGIVTFVSFVHPENANASINVTPGGIVAVVRLVHPSNELLSIIVTVEGIGADVSFLHCLNALIPRFVVPAGIVMDGSAIRYSNTPEYILPIFTNVPEVFFVDPGMNTSPLKNPGTVLVAAGSYPTMILPTSICSGIKFTRRDGDANVMLVRPEQP